MRSEEEIKQRIQELLDEANSLLPSQEQLEKASGPELFEEYSSIASNLNYVMGCNYYNQMRNNLGRISSILSHAAELQWVLDEGEA